VSCLELKCQSRLDPTEDRSQLGILERQGVKRHVEGKTKQAFGRSVRLHDGKGKGHADLKKIGSKKG